MKIVCLDAETFNIELPKLPADNEWVSYDYTPADTKTILERLNDADIVFVNKVQLTHEILSQLPKLKLIQIMATGMNNVDLEACQTLGITCYNVSGYAADTVPEHTFGLLLNLTRNLSYFHQATQLGKWCDSRQFCLIDRKNIDIKNKTLSIIGYGITGQRVAEIAKAFGMKVLIAEHQGKSPRNKNYSDFEHALTQADVITLHCPLTSDTQALINKQTIELMAKKPILLNLSRGAVIDEHAVAEALISGHLTGFATDVLSTEPPTKDNPIIQISHLPQVVISPHNAWASVEAQHKLWEIALQQTQSFITNNRPA